MKMKEPLKFIKSVVNESTNISADRRKYFAQQTKQINDRCKNPYLNVAMIGNFSSGKSTYINALLGCNILKTDWTATTSIPTKIYYSNTQEPIIFVQNADGVKYSLNAGIEKARFENTYHIKLPNKPKEMINFLTTSNQYIELFKWIEIYLNGEYLGRDVCIIDTPGVNPGAENTKAHVICTQNVLREYADATIILFPAQQVYTHDFNKFLSENAEHFMDDAIFIVTMLDIIDENERTTIIEFVKRNLQEKYALEDPIVYGSAAKYATLDTIDKANQHWVTRFRKDQQSITKYLHERRTYIITKQLTRLLNQLLSELDQDIHKSTIKLQKDLETLQRNSIDNLNIELNECFKKCERTYKLSKVETKDKVKVLHNEMYSTLKKRIQSNLGYCNELYGDGYRCIDTYCKERLPSAINEANNDMIKEMNTSIGLLKMIKNNFYNSCKKTFSKYKLEINTIKISSKNFNSSISTSDFSNDISTDAFKQYQATYSSVEMAGLAGLLITAPISLPLAFLDSILDTNMSDGFINILGKFGNFVAQQTSAVSTARSRAYDAICEQLNNSKDSQWLNIRNKMDEIINSILEEMKITKENFTQEYSQIFEQKQSEYEIEVKKIKALIQKNHESRHKIKDYIRELSV